MTAKKIATPTVELWPIENITPYELNVKKHDKEQVALKATADAMLAIDTDLTTALGHLKGIGAAMDTKASLQATTRNKERVDDIRLMSENERDQQLLNATNWPLWYEDHRAQTAQLIALVGAGAGARGGRVSASQDAIDRGKAPNGTRRGGRS